MEITLSGMTNEVRVVQYAKAPSSMATVSYPPNVYGIVTAPPVPVYAVMVARSPFTV
jgi:hypothetical protein